MRKMNDFVEKSEDLQGYRVGAELLEYLIKKNKALSEILRLNQNENLFLSASFHQGIIRDVSGTTDIRCYPLTERIELEKALGEYLGVPSDQIVLGSGGDHIIELTLNSYLKSGDSLIAVTPTFSMYPRTTKINGAEFVGVDIDEDFSLNTEKVINKIDERSKILVLCNPNNPTANQFNRKNVERLIETFPGLVLVDEAYAEFGEYSLVEDVESYDNLVVLRTFSKAFGMAGLRLGYGVTNKKLATIYNEKYLSPYPLSSIALKLGVNILKQKQLILQLVEEIKETRKWLVDEMNLIDGVKAFPSSTNFVLASLETDYEKAYQKLLDRDILIRKVGSVPGYDNCIRVSLAPRELLEKFLRGLKEVIA